MKKWNIKKLKFKKIDIHDIDDRSLLINLYITQFCTLLLGVILMVFQKNPIPKLFVLPDPVNILSWGAAFAVLVLAADLLISRWVPEEATDDGGINERMFGSRAVWHIALISLVVSICEEVLFRGAVQHWCGPYWTSILFAAIHIRYLQHWLMTGLVFGISYGLGWIYLQTGSLWTPIAAHFLIDLAMGCILRFRDKQSTPGD